MSEIRFSCPSCQQTLEAPPEMTGEACECPNCQHQMTIPGPAPTLAADDDQAASSNTCTECGAAMEDESVLCLSCGFHKGLGKKISTDLG